MEINNTVADLYWPDGRQKETRVAGEESQELNQEDFFSLLTQQLAFQDPFKPVENSDMIAQMSSFQTSEGISSLNDAFSDLSSTMTSSAALQASTLVGKKVLIPVEHAHHDGSGFEGVAITGQGAKNLTVRIEDENNVVYRSFNLGDGSGNVKFNWDGLDKNGQKAPEGNYLVKVQGEQEGDVVELPTATYSKVDSVSLAGGVNDVVLNLNGLGGLRLNDVLEVAN